MLTITESPPHVFRWGGGGEYILSGKLKNGLKVWCRGRSSLGVGEWEVGGRGVGTIPI